MSLSGGLRKYIVGSTGLIWFGRGCSVPDGELFIEKLDAGRKALIDPLDLAFPDMEVDIVRIVELLLFDMTLALEEPGLGMLDLRHGVQKFPAGSCADVLDQRLVIERDLSVETEPAAYFLHKIDHLLGIDVEGVQMLIDREPQRWRSGSGMTHGVMLECPIFCAVG
jgi:hypothetical protein